MRFPLVLAFCIALTGCGVIYVSPSVRDVAAAGPVRVLPLTAETVLVANRSDYRAKTLPDAFFATAGTQARAAPAGAVPPSALDRQVRPDALRLIPPPSAPMGPYIIGVGDIIILATRSGADTVEQLSGLLASQNQRQGYTVQDDGAIAVPDVGRVRLAGLTIDEAEAAVFESLVEARITPAFSLEIAEFNSKNVSVGGAVGQAALVPITLRPLTLTEALTAAGGVQTRDEEFTSIRIYRDGQLYQIPLEDYLARPDLQSLRLASQDSVYVDVAYDTERALAYFQEQITRADFRQGQRIQALSELQTAVDLRRGELIERRSNFQTRAELDAVDRDYVYLTGEVTRPARFPLPFGRTANLADALYDNDGFDLETGNSRQLYLLRGADAFGGVTAYQLDASNAANLILATRLELRPNDVIFVAEQPITRWNRSITQIFPQLVTLGNLTN
ncbi:polysaccharide biosynthesis/export family protein [Jannaschia sp. LMIT008]|uniref:polysaccharide biosynthesis/export family protein n=1 Tax=Jannaschia maritima TaxID=3032585 RepID=UPI002811C61F|nr:polysaccharide biosynthesis/export family protein [Jannaschia sp. LMIT008]